LLLRLAYWLIEKSPKLTFNESINNKRAKYVRNRLHAIAAKVVQHHRDIKTTMSYVEVNIDDLRKIQSVL
jgi:hypothetical protein